ncbi:hypothetical protein PC129_g450 [Phytophthora cactorum]|uniref:P-loop containing nucleoside triphosphate hydrolase n=1 Tax=Phytophthora cactorum TaxID=29920 RepID=A0A329ST63_9STRA|nr:hypothetical protein PC111_g532 [Phytophthora cactorum]KAG2868389.1 hypothetical protein PC113_g1088 [Phytophthora cactorum]KAG2933667.1 hypothetical protein PC114_g1339 [Phytophthora cactorum]KAG2943522.1 hypothetical protein PC115_g734 [Phytophthora cactorum]KAG2954774.1 hypothetical protein PC117_g970 [Phytophthora cactorum]
MNFDRQNIVTNLHRPTIEGEKRHRAPNLPFSTWRVFLRTYLSKCYEEYYRAVEELLVVEEERCVTVTGTPGIGKSIFYAYFFDKFWWVHRVEWIVIAASHERDNHLNGLAFFDNDGGTMTYPWSDDKTLSNVLNALTTRLAKQRKEDEGKRDVDKQKKVFFLCDEPPPARREQMVVFVRSNEDWMQKVVKDDCCLFMPMWTPDELQKAALVLNFALDDAVIDQRYSICGGVARQCLTLWEKSVVHAKDRMLEAIAEITNGDDLQNLIWGR